MFPEVLNYIEATAFAAVKKLVELGVLVQVSSRKLICVVTSLGSKLTDREGFTKVINLVGDILSAPGKLSPYQPL